MPMNQSEELLPEHCRSLFLGDLSCFCQEADLYALFQPFGEIEEIRIKRSKEGNGLGYGFVTFFEMQSAMGALSLDGTVVLGRPVKLSWAKVRNQVPNQRPLVPPKPPMVQPATASHVKPRNPMFDADSVDTAQLHFSFISKQHVHIVTEATIREVFSHFGEVKDVSIKKTSIDQKNGEQTGYGFLHYPLTEEGIQAAMKAAKIIKQVHINHVLYDCRLTWSLEEIIHRRHQGFQMNSVQPSQGGPRANGFISNSPPSGFSFNAHGMTAPSLASSFLNSQHQPMTHSRLPPPTIAPMMPSSQFRQPMPEPSPIFNFVRDNGSNSSLSNRDSGYSSPSDINYSSDSVASMNAPQFPAHFQFPTANGRSSFTSAIVGNHSAFFNIPGPANPAPINHFPEHDRPNEIYY